MLEHLKLFDLLSRASQPKSGKYMLFQRGADNTDNQSRHCLGASEEIVPILHAIWSAMSEASNVADQVSVFRITAETAGKALRANMALQRSVCKLSSEF